MRRNFFILYLIVLLSGCYPNFPEENFNMSMVIAQDSMVTILTDMQLVDGALNMHERQKLPADVYSRAYTRQVLEKHGVTREEFEESIRYYSYYVEELDAIYEQVIIRLGRMEAEAMKKD